MCTCSIEMKMYHILNVTVRDNNCNSKVRDYMNTVHLQPVKNGRSKDLNDKNGSIMKVESIAECSL